MLLSPAAARGAVVVLSGLLLLAVPLFFVGGPDWVSSPLYKSVWNFGHVIFFTVLLVVIQWFRPLNHWRQWLVVTLVALLLSGVIEAIQHWIGRHASWGDVFNNLAGVWLGLFWGQSARPPAPSALIAGGRALSLLLLGPALWVVLETAWAEGRLRQAFPLINGFENRHEWQQLITNPQGVHTELSNSYYREGRHSLLVQMRAGDYAGLRVRVCYGDWSAYQQLVFDLFNPEDRPLRLMLRLSDIYHDRGTNRYDDRFNRGLVLEPGWNSIRVDIRDIVNAPQGRTMAMDQLCNLGLFAADLPQDRVFYWDNIRLEEGRK